MEAWRHLMLGRGGVDLERARRDQSCPIRPFSARNHGAARGTKPHRGSRAKWKSARALDCPMAECISPIVARCEVAIVLHSP